MSGYDLRTRAQNGLILTNFTKSVSLFGPDFRAFLLNMERYGGSLHIQSKWDKMQTEYGHFSSLNIIKKYLCTKKLSPYMNRILVKIFSQNISLLMINRFGGRYFCLTERYSVSLRIQFECVNVRTRITPNTVTFYLCFFKEYLIGFKFI